MGQLYGSWGPLAKHTAPIREWVRRFQQVGWIAHVSVEKGSWQNIMRVLWRGVREWEDVVLGLGAYKLTERIEFFFPWDSVKIKYSLRSSDHVSGVEVRKYSPYIFLHITKGLIFWAYTVLPEIPLDSGCDRSRLISGLSSIIALGKHLFSGHPSVLIFKMVTSRGWGLIILDGF